MTKTQGFMFDRLIRGLQDHGTHNVECKAYKVIGRYGSRSGLLWAARDLETCNCGLGQLIREALVMFQKAWPMKTQW